VATTSQQQKKIFSARPPLFFFDKLNTAYDAHLRLIGKCIVDFLLALIALFTTLHCMQGGLVRRKLSVCLSVRPSVKRADC